MKTFKYNNNEYKLVKFKFCTKCKLYAECYEDFKANPYRFCEIYNIPIEKMVGKKITKPNYFRIALISLGIILLITILVTIFIYVKTLG